MQRPRHATFGDAPHSELGTGSPDDRSSTSHLTETEPISNAMQSENHPTVLVAEDEPDMISLYEVWLQDEYDVITARDGREAIEHLTCDVDLVICDRRMPNVTGVEVVDRLHTDGWEIPIIVVSSCRPDTELGEDDVAQYLRKPVDRDTVTAAVRQVLK